MAGARLEFFLRSIGYPDQAPEGAVSFMLRVDGMEIVAKEANGRIVLSYLLSSEPEIVLTLCSYAAGRIPKEDAVLSCDRSSALLWQDAPANSGDREMIRLFETFSNSCDWWRERVDALRGGATASSASDDAMVIRP